MLRDAGRWTAAPAPAALVVGFVGLLWIGVVSVGAGARSGPVGTLVMAALLAGLLSVVSRPAAAPVGAGLGWLAVLAFSRPPYAELHWAGVHPVRSALWLAAIAVGGAAAGAAARAGPRLATVSAGRGCVTLEAVIRPPRLTAAVSRRRQLTALALAAGGLPLVTLFLVRLGGALALDDDLLIYLVALVAISLVGGLWPAVLSAVAASWLLNWFFTPPVHTWAIGAPQNLLALVLFVAVAVIVSLVVHLAARRAAVAARSSEETATLLDLARTMLAGSDTPTAVLDHLVAAGGGSAELLERVGERWVPVAVAGQRGEFPATPVPIRADLRLDLYADPSALGTAVLDGYAAQVAVALDRERLRAQAAQAEMLAEGNRIRTALLAAVSHDLRTPLASVKASVSSLRQSDVEWSAADRAELLATIEEGADRLDALIGNLLDMSRLQTGSLEPFLRPIAVDEVAPLAVRGLDGGGAVLLDVSESVPLVLTDPGLLERALANLVANALRYSPADRPPSISARGVGSGVAIDVVDHGPGVPLADRDRIFEPFQRLGDRRSGGVGLGLAVARGFVEAMGGRVEALETPGGGLTMCVTLRAAADPARRPVAEPA